MSIQHFAKRLSFVLFFVIVVIIVLALSVRHANATTGPDPFLITPYFGTKEIKSNFDHEFPTYGVDGTLVGYNGVRRGPPAAVDNCTNGLDGSCYNGHDGIDFALTYEHVIAAADGVVTRARWDVQNCHNGNNCNYGLVVEINHGNGYFTRYGHLSAIAVSEGQPVSAGQIIGTSGDTGHSGGAHLHFGVFLNDTNHPIDPFGWSGTGADPWSTTSYCLWKDGEWANVCGRVRRPIPEPINGGETFTYATIASTGGFSKGENNGVMPPPFNNACMGDCANWTVSTSTPGYKYTTLVNGTTPDSWAKWQAPVPAGGGMYEVFVYIPSGVNAPSWQAPYTIRYLNNVTQTTALVDQYVGNHWVSLGIYYMTSNDYVFTTDATRETAGTRRLSADAVKFIRRAATYAPYINASSGWISTFVVRNDGGGPAQARLLVFDINRNVVCSGFTDTPVPAHGVQTWVLSTTTCPQPVFATVDGSQDLAMVVREENNGELDEYNGILASGGSLGWERAGTVVSVPIIKKAWGGRSSRLSIVNTGSTNTLADVRFYNATTGDFVWGSVYGLSVNGSDSLPADGCWPGLCTAQITSTNGMSVAVSIIEQVDATFNNRSSFTAFSAGATSNFVPLVKKNAGGQSSGISVENLGSSYTTISVTCYAATGNGIACGTRTNVASKETAVFVLSGSDGANLPDGFVGSAVVNTTAGQPVATLIHETGSPFKLATNALLMGTTQAYAPELYGDYPQNGQTWNAGISIQNTSSTTSANVTVTYYYRDGRSAELSQTMTLGPDRLWVLNYGSRNMPGPNFAGSAVIVADQPIAAIVNVNHTGSGDTKASYTAPNR
jgi:hypothetical protein